MKVDKQNGNVFYNDAEHQYWDEDGKYISVTTLIGRYENGFDKEFWSAYKALERIMSKDEFKMEKQKMLQTKKVDVDEVLKTYDISESDFNAAQQDILDEWQKENQRACERGTAIHAELEKLYTKKSETNLKKFGFGGKFAINTNETLERNNQTLLEVERGVFPEYLISRRSEDGIFKLAGQIDLLIKDGNEIHIYDYKTSKRLDEKSFFDSTSKKNIMMKYPLTNIMDCNKWHYALQLSTYAWMIQKINPEFVIKKLMLIHYDHSGKVTEHEVPYLRSEVERMCKDYKKHLILDKRIKARKEITWD